MTRATRPRRPQPPSASFFWAAVCFLLGAVGFVSLGVSHLVKTARSAELAMRAEATRTAAVAARVSRAFLSTRECLAHLPRETRFSVSAGRVDVPDDVGWLHRDANVEIVDTLPREAFELVERARRAEHRDADPRAAVEFLEVARQVDALDSLQWSWLALAAAQAALRAGDRAVCKQRLEELLVRFKSDGLPPTSTRRDEVICGTLLLCWRLGQSPPPLLEEAFVTVERRLGLAAIQRAAESEVDVEIFARLERELQGLSRRRELLQEVSQLVDLLRSWRGGAPPREVGDRLLLYFPDSDVTGHGALVSPAVVATALREAAQHGAIELDGRLEFHAGPALESREALPVVALLSVMPWVDTEPVRGGIGWTAATLVALAAFLVVGLLLSVRAVRRERLAARTRSEFLTAVTHELKTPLASIRLLTEVLGEDQGAERRQRCVQRLAAESARLSMLVDNVLDLGRLERGERGYDRRDEVLADVVSEAVRLYRPIAARDGLGMEVKLDGDQVVSRLDRAAIVQVLLNLFENARRYGAEGGRFLVEVATVDGCFVLRVRDWGVGIPEVEREAIFARFGRGAAAREGANPGVGLGLFLARSIVRDHGGELECLDPADGDGGAAFEMRLPLAAASSSENLECEPRPTRLKGGDTAGRRANPAGDGGFLGGDDA